ncbi:MAG: hypothetical protein VX563_02950 [Planctomycetota bacterium]|nr:hypothetical protein [Planctomycetota bacterium]
MGAIAGFITVLLVLAQDAGTGEDPPPRIPEQTIGKVAIVGASVSAGFGVVVEVRQEGEPGHAKEMIAMKDVLMAADGEAEVTYLDLSSHLFFSRPREFARSAIDRTLAWKPDLVLAVDFLFWFAYGYRAEDSRLDSLRVGLALLDELAATGVPMVIGELPDLEGIRSFVITEGQIPDGTTIREANRIINAWASERGNVGVVPIAGLSESLRQSGELVVGDYEWNREGTKRDLIAADQLHPTFDGLVCLVQAMEVAARDIEAPGGRLPPLDLEVEEVLVRLRARRVAPRRRLRRGGKAGLVISTSRAGPGAGPGPAGNPLVRWRTRPPCVRRGSRAT